MFYATNNEQFTDSFTVAAPFEIDCERFSTLTKLLRVTSRVLKLIKRLKGEKVNQDRLIANELDQAERMWIIHEQKNYYGDIFTAITKNKIHDLQFQL